MKWPVLAANQSVRFLLQLAMIVVVIPPLMTFWTKTSQKIWKAKMKESDKRSKSITEIMNSSKLITLRFSSTVPRTNLCDGSIPQFGLSNSCPGKIVSLKK
jgi:hypothetical protein